MNRKITVYSLLQTVNIIVFILMVYVYCVYGDNRYINSNTIILNSLQALLSFFVVKDASRHNNHLLGVLAFVMIIHFQLRIVTLNYTEFSVILDERVNIDAKGINYVLLYEIIAYLLTAIGFHYFKKPAVKQVVIEERIKKKAAKNILVLLFSSLGLSLMASIGIPGIAQIVGILSTFFFNLLFMMLFGVGFFLYKWSEVSKSEKTWFIVFIVLYIAISAGIGKRSSFYSIAIMAFFCMLAFDRIYVKYKYVFVSICFLPVLVWFFTYSTFTRQNQVRTLSISEAINMSKMLSEERDMSDMRLVLYPVFNRIGFFDFTVEMVHNYDHLSKYLKPENYFKSVVDNLLTPGFDVFDMPKMSYVITKCYYIPGEPSTRKYRIDENYQSDATSWFGEAYLLFGRFLSLPIVFLVGVLVKQYYVKLSSSRKLKNLWKKTIVLYLVYTLLYSYGLDWWLIYLVSFVINYWIFSAITLAKNNKRELLNINR